MYRAPTVAKAFQILERIAASGHSPSLSDLSHELGISKSTVHGITAALEAAGAVVRDHRTKRYSLGPTLFELGSAVHSRLDLKDTARPVMQALMERTAESVFLGIRNNDHVAIIDIVESHQDLKITAPVGTRIPLLAGATGKVFLAGLPEARARELIEDRGLHPYTEHTITDPGRYLAELELARRNGYALDHEEYISGVHAVAAPIAGAQPAAAIWVVGFTPSLGTDRMTQVAAATLEAARAISRAIEQRGMQ